MANRNPHASQNKISNKVRWILKTFKPFYRARTSRIWHLPKPTFSIIEPFEKSFKRSCRFWLAFIELLLKNRSIWDLVWWTCWEQLGSFFNLLKIDATNGAEELQETQAIGVQILSKSRFEGKRSELGTIHSVLGARRGPCIYIFIYAIGSLWSFRSSTTI